MTNATFNSRRSTQNGANPNRAKGVGSARVVRDRFLDRRNNLIPVTITHVRARTDATGNVGEPFDPFADLDMSELRAMITERMDDDYEMNRLFYDGDHWQDGEGWTGPRPDAGDATLSDVLLQIERAFVSKNCVAEVVKRHVNGCVGKEPAWYFTSEEIAIAPRRPKALSQVKPAPILDATGEQANGQTPPPPKTPPSAKTAPPSQPPVPTAQKPVPSDGAASGGATDVGQADAGQENVDTQLPTDATQGDVNDPLIMEAEASLTRWWDKRKMHTTLDKIVTTALLGEFSVMRIFVPSGLVEENGFKAADLDAALDMIYVDAPDPMDAGVVTDTHTMRQIGAYFFNDDDGTEMVELSYTTAGGDTPLTILRTAVATGVDEEGNPLPATGSPQRLNPKTAQPEATPAPPAPKRGKLTPTQAADASDGGENLFADEAQLDLGGRLTMYELQVPKMITEQVRALQRAINKALTMGDNNVNLAGFLERTILNGQVPGYIEETELPNGGKRKTFRREKYEVGGGSVNFVQGVPIFDNNGKTIGMANPSIVYKDPTPSDVFDTTSGWFYRSLLESVDQVHYLLAGEQYASGESRKQARADFEASLRKTIAALNEMGRWLLETVLSLAAAMTNQAERFAELRCVFNARIDPGPATVEGIRAAIELNAAGGLSTRTMMSWSGVDDVDAELRLIQEEQDLGIGQQAQQLAQAQAELDANRLASSAKQQTDQNADKTTAPQAA